MRWEAEVIFLISTAFMPLVGLKSFGHLWPCHKKHRFTSFSFLWLLTSCDWFTRTEREAWLMKKEKAELELRLADLRQSQAFLHDIRELNRQYLDYRHKHPKEKETVETHNVWHRCWLQKLNTQITALCFLFPVRSVQLGSSALGDETHWVSGESAERTRHPAGEKTEEKDDWEATAARTSAESLKLPETA